MNLRVDAKGKYYTTHVSKLGVDVDEGFEPSYEVIASRKKVLTELKADAKKADQIFIATDPDREGEAIGWHLAEELGSSNRKKIRRLMFNEITKKGVLSALEKPTTIDKKSSSPMLPNR